MRRCGCERLFFVRPLASSSSQNMVLEPGGGGGGEGSTGVFFSLTGHLVERDRKTRENLLELQKYTKATSSMYLPYLLGDKTLSPCVCCCFVGWRLCLRACESMTVPPHLSVDVHISRLNSSPCDLLAHLEARQVGPQDRCCLRRV